MDVTGSVFDSNVAKANGGVFKVSGSSQLTLSLSVANNNQATQGGVIFQDSFKTTTLTNSHFTSNYASQQGIHLIDRLPTVKQGEYYCNQMVP
jgi:hypothetical protein